MGHLFITFADYVNLLVFFGFDQFFRTLCMIVPFCGLVYNDLQAWHALRGDFDLLSDENARDEAYDTRCGTLVLWATDRELSIWRLKHARHPLLCNGID